MKIISIDNKDIIFLSLFLTFGEIQPCLFQYLEKMNLDLSLFINTISNTQHHNKREEMQSNKEYQKEYNQMDKNMLFNVTDKLQKEYNEYTHITKLNKNSTFDKPVTHLVFNISKIIPKNKSLSNRFNDTFSFILDYIYNYLSTEYITILDDNSRKNINPSSFITTINNNIDIDNNIDNNEPFFDNHNITIIIDSDLSRELIIRFGLINLLNGKTNLMPYDELYYFFNTYNIQWIKYIKGNHKKNLILYMSYFSYYKNNKFIISMLGQNKELMKLIRRILFSFANPMNDIKFIEHHIIKDNEPNTSYDSNKYKSKCYLQLKQCKMLNISNTKFDKLFDCRQLFPNFKKEIISINHMFYYNALLNNAFSN